MRLFLLLSILTLCSSQGFAQAAIRAEDARFQAMIRKDTSALKGMLHPDLIYVHSNGLLESKADHIRTIGTGKIIYESMKSERSAYKRWGKTALINGIVHVKGILNGNPFAVDLRYTALYRKKHGDWQLVNWQSTKV